MNKRKVCIGLLVVVIIIGAVALIRNFDKLISINKGESYSTTEGV